MYKSFAAQLLALSHAISVSAHTITHYWEVTWVWGAPDGFHRPLIGINGSWPCPPLQAMVGDTVIIHLTNKLGNETTGLHFHGVNQMNSNYMDGAVGISQCPLPPDYTITYSFTASDAGTYWYHSHNMGQYPDGFRGPLIIHNPDDPYLGNYDGDLILTISDWYHSQSPDLVESMLQPNNTRFLPPIPDGVLINEGSNGHLPIEPGKTYRMRIINFSAMTAAFVAFNALQMHIIMADGTYVQKVAANHLRILAAQRYDVLVTIGDNPRQNYPFLVALDTNPDYTATDPQNPITYRHNFTGQLVGDVRGNLRGKSVVHDQFYPQDDFRLVPWDNQKAFGPVTRRWVLDFDYCHDENGYPRACFNGKTFIGQRVPTLYSAVSLGTNNTEAAAYGQVGAFTVAYGDVVEIIINNRDGAIHPFHLHGHQFQIIERPGSGAGNWSGLTDPGTNLTTADATNLTTTVGAAAAAAAAAALPSSLLAALEPAPPVRRDTVAVFANSYAVLRIIANNPGVFLLHCHIEWHVEMGLSATLIEAPERLVDLTIPQDHLNACIAQGIPTEGNAGGNDDWYDTEGFVTVGATSYVGALYYVADESTVLSISTSTSTSASMSTCSTPSPSHALPAKITSLPSKRFRTRGVLGYRLE